MENLLQAPWRGAICCGAAGAALLFWYFCFFRATAPRKGTLEWIACAGPRSWSALPAGGLKGGGWQAVLGAALLGAAACTVRLLTLSPAQLPYAALSALAAAAFCLPIFVLTGSAFWPLRGAVLLLAFGMPGLSLLLFLCALLSLTLLADGRQPAALFLLLTAGFLGAAALEEPAAAAAIPLFAAAYGVSRLPGGRGWGAAVWSFLLLLLLAALALPLARAIRLLAERGWNGDWSLLLPVAVRFSVPPRAALPGLLAVTAAPVSLAEGIRRKDATLLLGGLLGLACLPPALFGAPALGAAGGLFALTGTLARGFSRGARFPACLTLIVLIFCILLAV